jgi:AraC-like DNA-binding protein
MSETNLAVDRLLAIVRPFITRLPGTYGVETPLPRLKVWSSTQATPPVPAMFKPVFYGTLQGEKALTIGGNRFTLAAGQCAATSFGMPYIGQIERATPSLPYVAIELDLDVDMLTNVMLDLPSVAERWVCSAAGGHLHGAVGEAFTRYVSLLASPDDQPFLARHHEIELYYHLLQSSMGDTLRQLGQRDSRSRQIKTAADWICTHAEQPLIIPDLAASVGMSLTSFHRHFKAVTGYSPLAFQRRIRLLEARRLLAAGGSSVSRIAYAVGYLSPSQFSREYKGLFGMPPAADLTKVERGVIPALM